VSDLKSSNRQRASPELRAESTEGRVEIIPRPFSFPSQERIPRPNRAVKRALLKLVKAVDRPKMIRPEMESADVAAGIEKFAKEKKKSCPQKADWDGVWSARA
jgi:hypothetical protein